jgi:hypothetical protein
MVYTVNQSTKVAESLFNTVRYIQVTHLSIIGFKSMSSAFYNQIQQQIEDVKTEGLYKSERVITTQQQAAVSISTG